MKTKSKFKKSFLLAPFSLITITTTFATFTTSCSIISSNNIFRYITNENKEASYNDLKKVPKSVRNLVFGTTEVNNGNYVLILTTNSDNNQKNFLYSSFVDDSNNKWNQAFWNVVEKYYNRKNDNPNYPIDGINFLIYTDTTISEQNWNPFAKYPDKRDDETATDEDKKNSNKYRREDDSAKKYREIAQFILDTYKEDNTVQSWFNSSNVSSEENASDEEKKITKTMIIAFRYMEKDGKKGIFPHFYSQTEDNNEDTDNPDNDGDNSDNNETPSEPTTKTLSKNIKVTPNTKFSNFIEETYFKN